MKKRGGKDWSASALQLGDTYYRYQRVPKQKLVMIWVERKTDTFGRKKIFWVDRQRYAE